MQSYNYILSLGLEFSYNSRKKQMKKENYIKFDVGKLKKNNSFALKKKNNS